ncbi:lymphocyte antigen 6A-2/6E-1-like [Orycteropus afer afer]|uniref:Lymphocyte antigen 6A-2/6E-1-like n=1 Tax=Orycteropus afer afer TaxID=1230840 RepID=A0A8B6ZSP0_ORYAF|nr:lymphocyte antigen 6A-2/6E-1-like [Orycteropus afer afer]
MKTLALPLLVALLCTQRAQGLRCYQCYAAPYLGPCREETCDYPAGVCVSQEVIISLNSEEIKAENKLCLPSCPRNNLPLLGDHQAGMKVDTTVSCCNTDLCNRAGQPLAGGLLLGLGLALLQALLW